MSDLALETSPDGVLLPVQAQPKARRNGLAGLHDGRVRVQVTQAPEKGRANAALEKVIAKSLGLRKSQVTLHSGEASRSKTFLVADIDEATLRERIAAVLG